MTIEQATYQVRFDWGPDGVEAIGVDADVVVWVDAIATGPPPDLPPAARGAVLDVDLRTSAAAAHWLLGCRSAWAAGSPSPSWRPASGAPTGRAVAPSRTT